jgi:hypothetical protein
MWDEWRTLAPGNMEFVGLTSGWVILNTLVCIMVCMGVLSLVRLVPEHDNSLRHLVIDRWFIFATPILLLYVAIMMFVACILGTAYFIYGPRVMYGGLVWAAFVFAMVLVFQMTVTEAVFAVNPPTHYVFNSPINPARKVHAKVSARLASCLAGTHPLARADRHAHRNAPRAEAGAHPRGQ